ncbi:hypothetical protein OAS86_04210, partial [Gammaproteobacteria bacterium]|nr:hypothetical protein [Gammaproteobacteria bacterium]
MMSFVMCTVSKRRLLPLALLLVLPMTAMAARVESLLWTLQTPQKVEFSLAISEGVEPEVETLSPRRYRIRLPSTKLPADLVDLAETGPVAGVFPFQDGPDALLDLRLRDDVQISIMSYPGELAVSVATLVADSESTATLTAMDVLQLPAGYESLLMSFRGVAEAPKVMRIDDQRIEVEFSQSVGEQAVSSPPTSDGLIAGVSIVSRFPLKLELTLRQAASIDLQRVPEGFALLLIPSHRQSKDGVPIAPMSLDLADAPLDTALRAIAEF